MKADDSEGVSVVIATRGRPAMLRAAITAIFSQDYAGEVEVVVVFDQIPIDLLDDLEVPSGRGLSCISNTRAPGLAGARNSGVLASDASWVAFCDDDDEWLPTKLTKQFSLCRRFPDAVIYATGMRVQTSTASHDRLPPELVHFADLLESRISEIHPSSFLMRRSDLIGRIGLMDEKLPASYGEDYDLLLRAARHGAIASAVEPLIVVNWNRVSFFAERWSGIADGLTYLLEKHPEFEAVPSGAARVEGQIAFAHAARGVRGEARLWADRALRHDPKQLRAWASRLVAWRILSPTMLVRLVNRSGRGL